jgi:hypothetical protein
VLKIIAGILGGFVDGWAEECCAAFPCQVTSAHGHFLNYLLSYEFSMVAGLLVRVERMIMLLSEKFSTG